jgi:hypothetical protein
MSDVASSGVNPDVPSVARVYDYLLGGKDNYESDRAMSAKLLEVSPETRKTARMNKDFGSRATHYIASQGVRQFIDLGSGIPTSPPSTHDTARALQPDATVVYVDHDPVVVAHSRALRVVGPGLTAILADIREPDTILTNPQLLERIDFSQPFAVLLFSVMQTINDCDEARDVLNAFVSRMAPGSYLAMSHISTDSEPQAITHLHKLTKASGYPPVAVRSYEELGGFFEGFDMVEPGIVDVRDWAGEGEERPSVTITLAGAVGRKR